ncbi:hypothetical protein HK405_008369, partial [Cladochytrium tenue]
MPPQPPAAAKAPETTSTASAAAIMMRKSSGGSAATLRSRAASNADSGFVGSLEGPGSNSSTSSGGGHDPLGSVLPQHPGDFPSPLGGGNAGKYSTGRDTDYAAASDNSLPSIVITPATLPRTRADSLSEAETLSRDLVGVNTDVDVTPAASSGLEEAAPARGLAPTATGFVEFDDDDGGGDKRGGGPRPRVHIYYELFGTGPKRIFLVIGLSATCIAWYTTVQGILSRDPDAQVLVLDNRGCGESSTEGLAPFRMRDLARDSERLLDHVGWRSGVAVCGLSMGGMIVLELLLLPSSRGRFTSAVLLSTHAGFSMPTWPTVRHIVRTRAGTVQLPLEADIRHKIKMVYPKKWLEQEAVSVGRSSPMGSPPSREASPMRPPSSRGTSPMGSASSPMHTGVDDDPALSITSSGSKSSNMDVMTAFLHHIHEKKGRQPQPAYKQQVAAVARHHVSPERLRQIGDLGIPVHVVAGSRDSVVRAASTIKLHKRIPGSKLTVVKGAGHGIKDEAPEKLLDI